jgi:hypothetical protein
LDPPQDKNVLLAAMALFIKGIARTKVHSLMKLGVSERLAIACGITSTKSRRLEAKALVEAQKKKELTLR